MMSISDIIFALRARPAILVSALYFICFFSYGYLLGVFGPSIVILQHKTNTTLEQNSLLVSVRAAGFFSGSVVSGYLFDRFSGHVVLSGVMLVGMVSAVSMPIATQIWQQGIAMLGLGALMGSVDTGCNALLVFLHGDDVHPYFHAMHLLFTSGAAVSPLILEALLSAGQSFEWAWWIMATIMLATAILLPMFNSPVPREEAEEKNQESDEEEAAEAKTSKETKQLNEISSEESSFLDKPSNHRWFAAIMAASFIVFYYGSEVATGSLLASYVRLQGLATISQANYITFSFWASQSVGLATSIYISHRRVNPRTMLLGNLMLMASGLILFWVFRDSLAGSWIAAIVFGLGVSSGFPTVINLTQTYTEVTGKITALNAAMSAVGEMTIPAFIGSRMEKDSSSPIVFVVILGISVTIQALVYTVWVLNGRQKPYLSEELHIQQRQQAQEADQAKGDRKLTELETIGADDDAFDDSDGKTPYFESEADNRSIDW